MRVIVLSLTEDLSEMRSLLETLNMEIAANYVQRRQGPHVSSYFGSGKIEEVLEEAESLDFEKVIVNDDLKPSQHHYLEMAFQKECIDRVGVILRIFSEHAQTPEAIAQVQLARLKYELPFLREWIHKAKSGERPGFLAGGAYATDVYYEHARAHMRRIEGRLSKLSHERKAKRQSRKDQGRFIVSLAGYTNAGKSALLNALCDSESAVSSQMFSSLGTVTRRVRDTKGSVLMIDTVGFIRNLPPDLVDAFESTLEEIFFADLILLIVDVSEDDECIRMKVKTCLAYLEPHIQGRPIVVVGSKADMISPERIISVELILAEVARGRPVILTSSTSQTGLTNVLHQIIEIQNRTSVISASLPLTDASYSLVSGLYELAVVKQNLTDCSLNIELKCNPDDVEKIKGLLMAAGGSVERA